jgi:hypothetical protein
MFMYCPKHRASVPVSIDLPATSQRWWSTFFRPALFASSSLADGDMSGVPTDGVTSSGGMIV